MKMQYQGENYILSKLFVRVLLFLLFFVSPSLLAQVQNNEPYSNQFHVWAPKPIPQPPPIVVPHKIVKYIVPNICVQRAVEIQVFTNKDSAYTSQALDKDFKGDRNVDFNALDLAYSKTLTQLNDQLEDSESEMFKYLINCKNDEEQCHNYFDPTNPFHVRLFCDSQIYESMANFSFKKSHQDFQKNLKIAEKYSASLDFEEFAEQEKRLKSSRESITTVLEKWANRISQLTQKAMRASVMPEAFSYILQKSYEDFMNLPYRDKIWKTLDQYYSLLRMSQEFKGCCENTALLADYQVAASYAVEAGDHIASQLPEVPYLKFTPTNNASALLLDGAEGTYWKKRFQTQSPLKMDVAEQLKFFKFLEKHPFFFKDSKQYSYENAKSIVRQNPKSAEKFEQPKPREVFFNPELATYRKSVNYKEIKPFYPLDSPYGSPVKPGRIYADTDFALAKFNEQKFMQDFIFNPQFSYEYMMNLKSDLVAQEDEALENAQAVYYRQLAKGFIPYAFGRAAKARLIRELQKYKRSVADTLIIKSDSERTGLEKFKQWAQQVICDPAYEENKRGTLYGSLRHLKSYKLNETYCSAALSKNRFKTYEIIYNAILSGDVKVIYVPETSTSYHEDYLYRDEFLKNMNSHIQKINDYCWNNYNRKGYEEDPDKFEKNKDLLKLWDEFYAFVGEELMGQTLFSETLEFHPSSATQQCYTEGHVFGSLEKKYSINWSGLMMHVPIWIKSSKSLFQLDVYDMRNMENSIERKLVSEFEDLDSASRYNKDKKIQKFLEESVSFRTLAMIEYAQDHPSQEIGKFICRLIMSSNDSEVSKQAKIELIQNVVMGVGIGASIVFMPALLAGTATLVETGMVLTFVTVSVATSEVQVAQFRRKNNLLDQSVITKSMFAKDAMLLHEINNDKITAARIEEVVGAAAMLALAARPLMGFGKFVKILANQEYRFQTSLRLLNLEHYVRGAGIEAKYLLSNKFKDFFAKRVAQDEAQEFMKLLNKRNVDAAEIEDFIHLKWGNELGNVSILQGTKKIGWIGRNLIAPIKAATSSFLERPFFFKIKSHWLNFWIKNFQRWKFLEKNVYDRLAYENKMVKVLNRSMDVSNKAGKKIFSEEELEFAAQQMKFYVRDFNGKFVRVLEEDLRSAFELFRNSQPYYLENPKLFNEYFEDVFSNSLLNRNEWMSVFESMMRNTRQIKTESDLKCVLMVVKFANREYTGVATKLRNLRELINLKEISGPVVYRERAKVILENFDRYYDIAQFLKFKNNVRFNRTLKDFALDRGLAREEIIASIEKKSITGEKLAGRLNDLDQGVTLRFDETDLINKYERQFWKQEKDLNDYFHKVLKKNLKRNRYMTDQADVFGDSYFRASIKASQKKTLLNECTHPSSIVRGDINALYKKFLIYISMTASGVSYVAQHHDEPIDAEWLSRMSFDVFGAYFINKFVFSPIYTSKNQSPIIRDFLFYPALVAVGTAVDGTAYQALIQSNYNDDDRYKEEFAKLIYESDNVEETLKQYFSQHPEVEKNIMDRFTKLESIFQQVKEKPENLSPQGARDLFVKTGLVESYFADESLKGVDRMFPDKSMYQTYVDEGYIDADMFSNEGEMDDQIIDIMTDIVYQDVRNHGSMDPEAVSDEYPEWLPFDHETYDRMKFNLITYETVHAPIALLKNSVVYQAICYGRYLPSPASVMLGLGAYTAYKAALEPWKFETRDEQTGH